MNKLGLSCIFLLLTILPAQAQDNDVRGGFFSREEVKKDFFSNEVDESEHIEDDDSDQDSFIDNEIGTSVPSQRPAQTPTELIQENAGSIQQRIQSVLEQMQVPGSKPPISPSQVEPPAQAKPLAVEKPTGFQGKIGNLRDEINILKSGAGSLQTQTSGPANTIVNLIVNATPERNLETALAQLERLLSDPKVEIGEIAIVGFNALEEQYKNRRSRPTRPSGRPSNLPLPTTYQEYLHYLANASAEELEKLEDMELSAELKKEFQSKSANELNQAYAKINEQQANNIVLQHADSSTQARFKITQSLSENDLEKVQQSITSRADSLLSNTPTIPDAYKKLLALGFVRKDDLKYNELSANFELSISPTWIIRQSDVDYIFAGNQDFSRFFDLDGKFIEADTNVIPKLNSSYKLNARNIGKVFKQTTQGTRFTQADVTVFTLQDVDKVIVSQTSLPPLPTCSENHIESSPVGRASSFMQMLDIVFYDPNNLKQRQAALAHKGRSVAYVSQTRSDAAASPDPLLKFARSLNLRCLPTRFLLNNSDGTSRLEYREGDAAWSLD